METFRIMELIPEHSLGFQNAWLLSLLYGVISFGLMALMSKERRKGIFSFKKYCRVTPNF